MSCVCHRGWAGMGRSIQPSFAQVRDLYRLFADVRAAAVDPIAQRRMLVDGMVALLDAEQGFCSEASNWFAGQRPTPGVAVPGSAVDGPTLAYVNRWHVTQIDEEDALAAEILERSRPVDVVTWEQARPNRPPERYASFYDLLGTIRVADVIDPVSTRGDGHVLALSIHRLGHRKPFDGRDRALVRLAAEELHPLHVNRKMDLTPPDSAADGADLTPRQQQILAMLLSARAPKQIAAELGLSLHTARDHIKAIYRKLGVSGRDELMTQFIRRDAGVH